MELSSQRSVQKHNRAVASKRMWMRIPRTIEGQVPVLFYGKNGSIKKRNVPREGGRYLGLHPALRDQIEKYCPNRSTAKLLLKCEKSAHGIVTVRKEYIYRSSEKNVRTSVRPYVRPGTFFLIFPSKTSVRDR